MRAATLDLLAGHRRARVEVITDRLVETIVASNPGYRRTALVPVPDLRRSCHDNVAQVLELVALTAGTGRDGSVSDPAEDPAYDAARETGRRRAEQGLPLDDVLRSFRMGGRLIWDDLLEQASDRLDAEELREVGTRLWVVVDETSAQVAAAYHATERAAVRADEQLRAELWEGVLNGRARDPGFAHEAARLLDVPVGADYVVVVADALDAAGAAVALGSRPSVWVRRSSGHVGLVALRSGESHVPGEVLGALGGLAGGPVGVSGVVAGLAGVDGGMRQATLVRRTLGAGPAVATIDDRLPEALLHTAPEVTQRLVEVWLGPLLALPDPERAPLLATLRAWVDTAGSTAHTAERVHCHRNTVLNRLRRVGELLGRRLLDGPPPLELQLALCAVHNLAEHAAD